MFDLRKGEGLVGIGSRALKQEKIVVDVIIMCFMKMHVGVSFHV